MFCFLSIVPKGKTIRKPGMGGGGGFPVDEILFSQSWLQEFFPKWKVYCLDGVLLARVFFWKNFPCRNFFPWWGGGEVIVTPPPGISNGRPLREQNSFDTTLFLWLELTRQAMLCS